LEHCTFINNSAVIAGALFAKDHSGALILESEFSNNLAYTNGGAVSSTDSADMTFTNVLFHNNTARSSGGALISTYPFIPFINDDTLSLTLSLFVLILTRWNVTTLYRLCIVCIILDSIL